MPGTGWKGIDGEDDMSQDDWDQRCHDQAMAAYRSGDPFLSSPDETGTPTGGCYNGDYPDSYHDAQNARLESDEHFEAEVDRDVRELYHEWQD
jgi:hypothetical protein